MKTQPNRHPQSPAAELVRILAGAIRWPARGLPGRGGQESPGASMNSSASLLAGAAAARMAALLLGFALFAGALDAAAATASPPERMTYQGFLVDANGVALATNLPANYAVVFRIYDASTGGNIIWSEQQTVTVDKGNFSVLLGEGTAVSGEARPDLSTVFSGATASDRYIGITVTISGTAMIISPRLRLLPSPYAFAASKAASVDAQSTSRLGANRLYLNSGTDVNSGLG